VLDVASECGITVIASASLSRGQLAIDLPEDIIRLLAGLETDAQRAIQFARSTPGVTAALVGMRRVEHVNENLRLARVPVLDATAYERIRHALAS
jgi:aryl-alcohol dehydrogenase-like predicted oxidoreductase